MSHCNRCIFVSARSGCNRVLKEANFIFADRMKRRLASHKFGSKEYWKFGKNVLSKIKFRIPPLHNQFELITSTAGKDECFAMKYSSISNISTSAE